MSELNTQESSNIPEVTFTLEVSDTVQAPVDSTLSIAGMAADAKATGDAIADAQSYLQGEIDTLGNNIGAVAGTLFPVGSVYVSISSTAPTFGGANWNWQEIMIPTTWGDLQNGARDYVARGSNDTPGTLHFWLRTADTEVSA